MNKNLLIFSLSDLFIYDDSFWRTVKSDERE